MTFHALVDFASLMGAGIFGVGTTVEQINQMSAANLIAVPVLLIPCIVFASPEKTSGDGAGGKSYRGV